MIGATLPPAEFTKLLLAHYPLTRPLDYFAIPNGSNNRVVGIRSGHGEFVCKTILAPHNLAALHHEQRLLHWLSNQELSFAVPASLPTHSGELILHNEGSYHILTPLLPGQKPDWHAPQQIELVGAALGELHPMLAAYPHATADALPAYGALKQIHPLVPAPDELTPHHLQLPPTPATTGELAWWREEMAAVRAFVEGPYLALPRQLIHSDFGHSNTLYLADTTDGRMTAVLDFEFAGPDVRAMDLASGLYFCMRIWENAQPLLNAEAFCRGYAQQQQLTQPEIEAIPWLMRLRNVASAIWWFGRRLAAGKAPDVAERIGDLQQFVAWLDSAAGHNFAQILQLLALPSEKTKGVL